VRRALALTGIALRLLMRHAGVGISLALIVTAFVVGWRAASPREEQVDTAEHAHESGEDVTQRYTCSMHPSVRLPDPDAKCPICFMDLIPVTEDASGGASNRLVLSEGAAAMSRIETAPVARFFPTVGVRLSGKLTPDETRVARISAFFPGRIDRLFVNYVGVPIRKGDHVAEVYGPDLLTAFEELRQANAGARTGGDILRGSARATQVAAREKLRLLGLTPEQIASVEDGTFTGDTLTLYSPIGGTVVELAKREGDYVATGSSIVTVADLTHLWLDLEAYESQLPMLRWGQRVSFTVRSHPGESFEGRVAFIEPIVDDRTRTAAVRVAVANADGSLKPGMFASATVQARIGAGGAVLSDELAGRWVSPMHPTEVHDGPGVCGVCGMDLVPAESLGVVGDPLSVEEPLVIPRTAALVTGKRAIVYVLVPNSESPTYESREVVLGPRAGEFSIVASGLREGERVVVNGAFRIDSAMQIAAKPSMMSPGVDGSSGGGSDAVATAGSAGVPDRFIHSLKPVYSAYLDAQETLADDDFPAFLVAAGDVEGATGKVIEIGVIGESLGTWRRAAARLRSGAEAANIDEARAAFEGMSIGVIDLHRRFGHHGSTRWYIAYCPMAFDNKGAEWVQRGEVIDNPYFGAMMLRCGEIRDELPPVDVTMDGADERGRGDE
jgi:Cu(I)/Ag(I) efflux system membrane fusion protein